MPHFVYIMCSRPDGAYYVGRTGNLSARIEAHRAGLSAHTARYKIRRLVWFEGHAAFDTSLQRERTIKRWRREWKAALVTAANPTWSDITHLIAEEAG
ncbi:MAG: GIY-YIG nuclease family protein [Shimia sp.]